MLFVECVPTSSGPGFYSFWCALCNENSSDVRLFGDPIGVRIPSIPSLTHAKVGAAAAQLGPQRFGRWRACNHVTNLLVVVLDTNERFCPRCFALYDGDRLLNEPRDPQE